MKVRRLVQLVVGLLVVGGIVYAFMPKPVRVDLGTVQRGELQVTVDEDGKTRIKENYVVSTPLAGRLLRIQLEAGDEVHTGKTLLAAIEPTDPTLLDPRARAEAEARVSAAEARLKQAGATLDRALAAMQFSEAELGRTRELHTREISAKQELEQKEMMLRLNTEEYRSARFAEEISQFELQQSRAALMRTTRDSPADDWNFDIRSPINGRVLRVFQESSTVVTPGTQLLELGDPSDLEVVIDVLSSDAVKIAPGNSVFLEQWGGEVALEGNVRLVEPSAFTKVSALGVEEQRVNVVIDFVEAPDQRGTLGDGFRVEARIVVWQGADVLKVPTSALFRQDEQWAAFAVVEGRAELRHVTIGHRNNLFAEALDGLNEGDVVIVHASDQVVDGVAVVER